MHSKGMLVAGIRGVHPFVLGSFVYPGSIAIQQCSCGTGYAQVVPMCCRETGLGNTRVLQRALPLGGG